MIGRAFAAIVVGAILTMTSCTHDFDSFDTSTAPNGSAGKSGAGGSSQNDGSVVDSAAGGASQGGGGAGGGTGGGAGRDGSSAGDANVGTGGTPPDGSPGTGGAPVDSGAGGGTGGNTPADGGCSTSQKVCGGLCVAIDDPTKGCDATGCTPCSIPHATATCSGGACAVGTCDKDYGDCDKTSAAPGCERLVRDDIANCGGCDRKCSTASVASLACTVNACTSSCAPGRGNCSRPTSGADDGCESDVLANNSNCGGCGNNCGAQNGKVCNAGVCSCDGQNFRCRSGGSVQNIVCDTSGLCKCNGVLCAPGESCTGGGAACVCNGGTACASGQTCCQTPKGCFDLQSDAANCGGCGHACTGGFACVAGACRCDADPDCNAGSAGICTTGVCTCGTTTCAAGQRCLPSGGCG